MSKDVPVTTGPHPYTRGDWQWWALLPVLAVVASAGAAYQIGVNLKSRMSAT